MKGRLKALALVGLVALLLAACSGGQAATQPTTEPATQAAPQPTAEPATQPAPQPTTEPATQPGAAQSAAAVTIQGFAFDPAVLTVKVGTTVTWTNKDGTTHTITSDTGVWDSGGVSPGETYDRVFDQAGSFSYHCAIHSSMKGTIVVTP